jgi:hypothetical protein
MADDNPKDSTPADITPRRPYEPPMLRVYGAVKDLTTAFTRDKGNMDGGPNNLKT